MLSAAIAAGTKRDIRHLHLLAISLLLEIVGRVFHYWRVIRDRIRERGRLEAGRAGVVVGSPRPGRR